MELPIAKQSYLPTPEALVRAVKRSQVILARTASEEISLEGATAFVNPSRPSVTFTNFASDAGVPPGGAATGLIDAIEAEFAGKNVRCAWVDCAGDQWIAELPPELERRGYRPQLWHVYLLHGYVPPTKVNSSLQIIPARAAYVQARQFFKNMARAEHGAIDEPHAEPVAAAMIDWLDEQRLEYFLARLNGEAVGCAGVLTLGQTGVIQPVYTDPAFRGKGIAATLLAHVLDHCQRALFEQVLLERHEGCPSIPFYTGLGFKPIAKYVRYLAPQA